MMTMNGNIERNNKILEALKERTNRLCSDLDIARSYLLEKFPEIWDKDGNLIPYRNGE